MTIPYERTLAVLRTRKLLSDLASGSSALDAQSLKSYAGSLLKHYPGLTDLSISSAQVPEIWGKPDGSPFD